MDFEPSDEQVMIGDSVALFGSRHYPPGTYLASQRDGLEATNSRWAEMAGLGWLGLVGPDGGSDADGYVMTLMEGFGRYLMREPYVTRCILVPALLAGSGGPVATGLMSGIADGRVAASLALGEPGGGFDLAHVATRAERAGDGYRLTGRKDHVVDGGEADWFVVPARTHGAVDDTHSIALFLIHRDAPGLVIDRYRSIDGHRHARLHLDAVPGGNDALLDPDGLARLEAAVDRAIVAHLAEALGSMDAVKAMTLDYIKMRHQFGKPLGSFQALQHRMVDIDIACEEARSMVYLAVGKLGADAAERRRAVSAAKARVGQCGLFVARQGIQLHGGVGVSAELIISHHLKRHMMLDLAYGNATYHRARFAATLDLAA